MIASTLKCNKFIDSYEVIAMLIILVLALMYLFLSRFYNFSCIMIYFNEQC
jgi:hypothetical protein